MSESTVSRRGQRRPAFVAAARRLFFEKGYAGTTVEQVAREAGFSKRTVYLYFKNKDELFLSVGEEGLKLLRRKLEEIEVGSLPVEQAVAAVLDIYLRFARKHPHYFRIIFQESTSQMMANIPERMRTRLEEHERACLGVVVTTVKRALEQGIIIEVDPWETAAIFWGTATGVIQLSMGGSQTVFTRGNREVLAAKAVWMLFHGLRAGKDEDQTET